MNNIVAEIQHAKIVDSFPNSLMWIDKSTREFGNLPRTTPISGKSLSITMHWVLSLHVKGRISKSKPVLFEASLDSKLNCSSSLFENMLQFYDMLEFHSVPAECMVKNTQSQSHDVVSCWWRSRTQQCLNSFAPCWFELFHISLSLYKQTWDASMVNTVLELVQPTALDSAVQVCIPLDI